MGPGVGGTQVTITGTNFSGATAVRFGSTDAAGFSVDSDTEITAVSPTFTGGSAAVEVNVTTAGGTSADTVSSSILPEFFFRYGPTVTKVEPDEGPSAGGTEVRIVGTGFSSLKGPDEFPFVQAIDFGSTELSCGSSPSPWGSCGPSQFDVVSETEITVVSPPGTGTVDVAVQTAGGASPITISDLFTYAPPEGNDQTPRGSEGDSGTGSEGDLVQLVTCRARKSATSIRVSNKHRMVEGRDQICTTEMLSGPVEPSSDDLGVLSARLMRGDVLYATGTATVGHLKTRIVLTPLRQVRAGRYRLTLSSHRGQRHELLLIR